MTQKRNNYSQSSRSDTPAMVRRSTLYVSVVVALLFGLYMGTLIPTLMDAPVASSGGAAPAADTAHIADAEEAVVKDPTNADAWIHLGNLYFDARMPEKSVMAYTKALEISPNNANVLTDRGTMYRSMKQFDLALASYRQANKVNPRHENSLFNAGIVLYYDLNRKDEAKKSWQELLRVNPEAKMPNGQKVKDMLQQL